MMHVSFFYYQLIEEGGFSYGQTSYWLFGGCTCWDLLDFKVVEPKGVSLGIDGGFIREAAVIYLLCMLLNQYEESEPEDYPKSHEQIVVTINEKGRTLIPEIPQIIESVGKSDLEQFKDTMNIIFKKYVQGRFLRLIEGG